MSAFALNNLGVIGAGGFELTPQPQALDHYSLRQVGPDETDAIIFVRAAIHTDVRPSGTSIVRSLPIGRVFSLTADSGTLTGQSLFKPGVYDADLYPVAGILTGSAANEGDVTGGSYVGNPQYSKDAQVPIKDEANLPFWSLNAGVIFETSEFQDDLLTATPGTPLTAVTGFDGTAYNFAVAGKLTAGTPYVDHIVGVLIERPAPCGINTAIQTIKFQGSTLPRLNNAAKAATRA